MVDRNEIEELRRRAGIAEERTDEDFLDDIASLNPGFARKLMRNFKRKHFATALAELAKRVQRGEQGALQAVAREYGLDSRVLQDYAREAHLAV